jgi:hypothetical protein
MLNQSLTFLENRLNQQLMREKNINEKLLVLTNISNIDGDKDPRNANKIVMSLVNIEEDANIKNINTGIPTSTAAQAEPFHLNCYILFSSQFEGNSYTTGLSYLSSILSFFKNNAIFSQQNAPELNPAFMRLSVELSNQSFETMHHLWQALGTKYRPSLLYKMRLLLDVNEGRKQEIHAINQIKSTSSIK